MRLETPSPNHRHRLNVRIRSHAPLKDWKMLLDNARGALESAKIPVIGTGLDQTTGDMWWVCALPWIEEGKKVDPDVLKRALKALYDSGIETASVDPVGSNA